MKIAFFGTPRLAQIVLEQLIGSPFKPGFVVTRADAKAGRGQKEQTSLVKKTAQDASIDVIDNLDSLPDFDLAILVAFGKIIPKNILAIPKYGFVNIHPSLLPMYRGPSPIQTAILDGQQKTGVSIILLDEAVDHGPILAQKELSLDPTDTHATLIEKLGQLGNELLLETLPKYLSGELKPQPQDDSKATFTKHIEKTDGFIDVTNPPERETLDRMIRAFYPWPAAWTKIDEKILKFLPGNLIQPEGKRPMTFREFKNGYPQLSPFIERTLT